MRARMRGRLGFTLLELLIVMGIVSTLAALLFTAIQRAREAANRSACQDHLRQMGLALHAYHDNHRSLPPGTSGLFSPQPFLGWLARILPWIEQEGLWKQTEAAFRQQPRFSVVPPHDGLATVIPVYLCPSDGRQLAHPYLEDLTVAFTHYLGSTGVATNDGTLFFNSTVRLADISDGTSQTLLAGERPPSADDYFGWWYAGIGIGYDGAGDAHLSVRQRNYTFREPTCPHGPYHYTPGTIDDPCDTFHFWSRHPGGANFLFADGSVHFLSYSADSVMPALASRSGGEAAELP